ncbi:helix-turn-helix transcriptional regulator [Rhodococcoides yunnanense]|uniref:LuxR C-terminal-related transcriptional regulator n=1 Tax=Rhodococcoides yunnanense TaxID=278209 RepID=A0ABU4BAY9_9NOCA|nr:LuxR C-terminal-related transcriptional regulator [Rhodococcus yunnanensis]MDV6261372.1 LuxR C-terminal-related transcriptional regulator [Rhodococcus yunnanensis]
MVHSNLLRPRDGDALRAELRQVAATSDVPVVFGGEVSSETLYLSEFQGTRTRGLDGLAIPPRSGLGGRVMEQRRPAAVSDYGSSMSITHHFDRPVLGEGLKSILAMPVVVAGVARIVMYAAVRERGPLGDRVGDIMTAAARRLGQEIAVRDEVDRRVRLLATTRSILDSDLSRAAELRSVHEELADLARSVGDEKIRRRLDLVTARIAATLGQGASSAEVHLDGTVPQSTPLLTPREIDVISQVALGCTNIEVAQRLSIGAETVKSYLRSVMRKTESHTRYEAVVACRRLGIVTA